jgi:hypothetical protein
MPELKLLDMSARKRVNTEFLTGAVGISVEDLIRSSERDVTIDPLVTVIESAMANEEFVGNPPASDAWLAPRVHAALRLTRREAADRRLWAWLAVVALPQYVRWRFKGDAEKGTALKRFFGITRDHALARLWWGAELSRNGSDYSTTIAAFRNQDFPNTWFSLRAFEHRAAAIAACRLVSPMSSNQINALATAFDHVITTVMLDSLAVSPPPDTEATKEWISGEFDDTDIDSLPVGPSEDRVPEPAIAAVEALLTMVSKQVGITNESEAQPASDSPQPARDAVPA